MAIRRPREDIAASDPSLSLAISAVTFGIWQNTGSFLAAVPHASTRASISMYRREGEGEGKHDISTCTTRTGVSTEAAPGSVAEALPGPMTRAVAEAVTASPVAMIAARTGASLAGALIPPAACTLKGLGTSFLHVEQPLSD